MSGPKRLELLAKDVMLLGTIGEVVTIQIDLTGVEGEVELLKEEFKDAEENGLYLDSMILQRILESSNHDYFYIFQKIVEITGDYDSVEGITALIRIMYNNQPVEITLQLQGDNRAPQLVQVTEQSAYFSLINFVKTRWLMASRL